MWTPPRRAAPGPGCPRRASVTSRHSPARAAPADPAAQLVQLGDAEPVGVQHDHHGGVGHVDADLDHRGGHQHVELAGGEVAHHRVLLVGRQPAVQDADPQPGSGPSASSGATSSTASGGRRAGVRRPAAARRCVVGAGSSPPMRGQTTYAWWPAADLLAQPPPGPVQEGRLLRGRHHVRGDRRPAARQLGQRGHLQVAEDGHRDRARDRRRGHHQHVRRLRRPWPAARRAARRRSGAARRPPPGRGRRSRRPRRAARGCRPRCRPRRRRPRPGPARRAAAPQRAGHQRDLGGLLGAVQLAGPAERAEQRRAMPR